MNPQDSQITLINTEADAGSSLVIVLDKDDVKQTVMRQRGEGNQVLYIVESDTSLTKTSVYRPDSDAPFALIETKELLGWDKITFRGERRRNIRDWISGYGIFQTFPMIFTCDGRRYHWRTNFLSQLGLFNDHDNINPIAWYERSRVRVVDGVLTGFRACLTLEEEAIQIQDKVVVSFLIIENQTRRDIRPSGLEGRAKLWL